jgi:hypothetical protein
MRCEQRYILDETGIGKFFQGWQDIHRQAAVLQYFNIGSMLIKRSVVIWLS